MAQTQNPISNEILTFATKERERRQNSPVFVPGDEVRRRMADPNQKDLGLIQLVDPKLGGHLADLAMVRLGRSSELRHLAEDRDGAPSVRPLLEILECGAHRHGVRVVCVVDQEPASRQRALLAPPA